MKLRSKSFLTLLAASLIPLLVVFVISLKTSKKLGRVVSAHAKEELVDTVKREMVSATTSYADTLGMAKRSIEFAVRLLAREAEIALALPMAPAPAIFWSSDFEDGDKAPKDLGSIPKAPTSGHSTAPPYDPVKVSLEAPVFFALPELSQDRALLAARLISEMIPTIQTTYKNQDASVLWIDLILEQGLLLSYPGHCLVPEPQDLRKDILYLKIKKSGEIQWSLPHLNEATGQMVIKVGAPVFFEDGTFAGAVGMDILVSSILLEKEITSQISSEVQSFLVGFHSKEDCPGPWILSGEKESNRTTTPSEAREQQIRDQALQKEFAPLLSWLKQEKAGVINASFRGRESFWTFSQVFEDLYFVLIIPKSVAMSLPDKVSRLFGEYSRAQLFFVGLAALVAVVLVALVAFFTSRTSTNMVMKTINAWKRLANGDYSVRLEGKTNDERDLIVHAFNEIVPRLEEHLRMSRALGLAQEVQQGLLPQCDPDFPGFDVAGYSLYCDETGGDYFDFLDQRTNGRNTYVVMVGDVSGHGISSALLMATARALVMLRASMPGEAAHIIGDVNRHLSQQASTTYHFMTFFYLELYPEDLSVCWVRAGHDPAIVYDPGQDRFDELKGGGPALGLVEEMEFEQHQRLLAPGQIIMVGTDGIWEMHNQAGEMFGKDRLYEIIKANAHLPAREIIGAVNQALDAFRGAKKAEDDVTMVVIKVK